MDLHRKYIMASQKGKLSAALYPEIIYNQLPYNGNWLCIFKKNLEQKIQIKYFKMEGKKVDPAFSNPTSSAVTPI